VDRGSTVRAGVQMRVAACCPVHDRSVAGASEGAVGCPVPSVAVSPLQPPVSPARLLPLASPLECPAYRLSMPVSQPPSSTF
jgi:hypothetical protein